MKAPSTPVASVTSVSSALVRQLQNQWTPIVVVLICAILVQTIFLLVLPSSARKNDSKDYVESYSPIAENILAGRGFVNATGELATQYPPGFPAYLAGVYFLADSVGLERMRLILFCNLVLTSLASVLVFQTAERIFNRRVALISAVLWITYPFNLWLVKQPNSEVPFIPLLFGAVYCAIVAIQRASARAAMACGLLLAMAALVRPIAVFLPFVVAGAFLLNRAMCLKKRVIFAAMMIGVYCVALLPWEGLIYIRTKQVVPLSTGGVSGIVDGLTFSRRVPSDGLPKPALELMQRVEMHRHELNSVGEIARYLRSDLKENGKAFLELAGLKVARSWYGTDSRAHERVIKVIQVFYLVICCAGIFLTLQRFPDRRDYVGFFVALALYFWGMAILALSILRYLVPVMAYMMILGAVAIDTLVGHWRKSWTNHTAEGTLEDRAFQKG